ncbi:DUF4157 domain-containing protein [Parabacteroides bouchesdurhonensis]|uniref:eCIS core domain-containing protein n=1 Tax=Parabacteroides bouchesdurhonensis TaxID=1936995 RepID=UPI000E5524E7|nr:DUF4157 domain-containing protein [Bacteroides sp. AM07-16]
MAERVEKMPEKLKAAVEALSGYSMDDVQVHYDSPKPAEIQALAYAQGTNIYLSQGQDKLLPHEAWHVVQQMQGRVEPTVRIGEMPVNDDAVLENEADVMGGRADKIARGEETVTPAPKASPCELKGVAQLLEVVRLEHGVFTSKLEPVNAHKGAEMTLKFQPNIAGEEVVGLIQIVHSTKPVDTVNRILRTAPSGYAIDSQSNNPVYGSANLQEGKNLSSTYIVSDDEAKGTRLSIIDEGGCICCNKRTPAVLYDTPQFAGNGQLGDKMLFEVYAFNLNTLDCLGSVSWSFELENVNDVKTQDIVENTNYTNFNSAVDQWNSLHVIRAGTELSYANNVRKDADLQNHQFYYIQGHTDDPKSRVGNILCDSDIFTFAKGSSAVKARGKIDIDQDTYPIVKLHKLP